MAKGSLNPKQQKFVDEYLISLNATQAALAAGYSEKTARSIGNRLLTNVYIQKAIAEAQAKRSERVQIDQDWVLQKLIDEVDADISGIYDDNNQLKQVKDWPVVFRKGLVVGMDVEEITIDGAVIGYTKKVKMPDRLRRLELIGKHLGMWKDEVKDPLSLNLNVSPELLAGIANKIRSNGA